MLRRRHAVPLKRKTSESTVRANVLGEVHKDAREAALEEEILGVGENVIDALPDVRININYG